MQRLGFVFIIAGAVATIAAMFLPYAGFAGVTLNWWESSGGGDIALLISCVGAASLGLMALATGRRRFQSLAGVGAAVVFGLASLAVFEVVSDTEGTRAGLWIVGGTGAVALAGALLVAISEPD